MGVRGLGKFIEENAQKNRVNLIELAKQLKKENKELKLVIDALGFIHYLYTEKKLNWLFGGQYEEFVYEIKKYVSHFTSHGISLHFIIDGALQQSKYLTLLDRRKRDIRELKAFMEEVKSHTNLKEIVNSKNLSQRKVLPLFAQETFLEALRGFPGVTIFHSKFEADLQIANYCVQEDCYAVVGKDSDYLILGTRYIPFDRIFLNSSSSLEVEVYQPDVVCQVLGIKFELLPLFSCLVGNDYTVPYAATILENLYYRMKVDFKNMNSLIKGVARFLSNQSDEQLILQDLLKAKREEDRIEIYEIFSQALKNYKLDLTKPSEILTEQELLSFTTPYLAKVFRNSSSFPVVGLELLFRGEFWCVGILGNLEPFSAEVTVSIRKKIYGLFFKCNTKPIKEFLHTNELFQQTIYPIYDSENPIPETIKEKKKFFLNLLDCDIPAFHDLAPCYLFPALVLRFILKIPPCSPLFESQLDAFILFIMEQNERYLTHRKIERDVLIFVNTTSIYLSQLFQTILWHICILHELCDSPFKEGYCLSKMFDGILWTYMFYYMTKRIRTEATIFDEIGMNPSYEKEKLLSQFQTLKKKILDGLNPQQVLKPRKKGASSSKKMNGENKV